MVTAAKTAICLHSERIENNRGVCRVCGQVREYDPDGVKPAKVLKRGQIDGLLTEIHPPPLHPPQELQEEIPLADTVRRTTVKPVNWGQMTNRERADWYDRHKAQILEDLDSLGSLKTRKKWNVTQATMDGLLRRWQPASTGLKPSNWNNLNRKQKNAWYEKHRRQIVADYLNLGITLTCNKWNIPHSTWRRLQDRWPELASAEIAQSVPDKTRGEGELTQEETELPWSPRPISRRTGIWGPWSF